MEECACGAEGGSAGRRQLQIFHIALHNASVIPRCTMKNTPKPVGLCRSLWSERQLQGAGLLASSVVCR